ncbi:ABC transporter permease subunit [Methanobacterium lacus]|nr:ABC transporter permease subunit [Methanobacterium lacus]
MMNFSKSWVIANKDFSIFMKKKRILYTLIILPLIFSIILPLSIRSLTNETDPADVIALINAFSYFYVILVYIQSTTLASYSILGEKIEQSLEPLLATPTTESELLLGKTVASFLPSVAIIYANSVIFMVLIDLFTKTSFGYLFYPNWTMAFILLVVVPLSSIFSIQLNVIISSRVNDVRTANQLGFLMFLPFMGLYIPLVTNSLSLNIVNLTVLSFTILLIDIILFYISKSTFNRDKILTKWK